MLHLGGPSNASDLAAIRSTPGVSVVDETVGKAVLVEATEEGLRSLERVQGNWKIAPELIHPMV